MTEIKKLANGKYFVTIFKKDFNGNDQSFGFTFDREQMQGLYIQLREIFSKE
jgi:hypothetical protein